MNQNNFRCVGLLDEDISSNPILQTHFKDILVGVGLTKFGCVSKEAKSLCRSGSTVRSNRSNLSSHNGKCCDRKHYKLKHSLSKYYNDYLFLSESFNLIQVKILLFAIFSILINH